MPEEPEQVLPEERLPAFARREEVRADGLIEQQHDRRAREHGNRQQHEPGRDEQRPDAQREPEPVHARRPQLDDRGDVVQRAKDGGEAQHDEADAPEHLPQVYSGVLGVGTERSVRGPSGGGVSALDEESGEHQQARGDEPDPATHQRRDRLDREGCEYERDTEPERVNRQQARAFGNPTSNGMMAKNTMKVPCIVTSEL